MKAAGRKTSSAYELYGFIPKVENGKHSAICISCNRVLQNTAAVRLQKHRNSCAAALASGGDPPNFPIIEVKKRKKTIPEVVQQKEDLVSNVKTEHSNMGFEDANTNDNTNDNDNNNTGYEEPAENLHDLIASRKSTTKKDRPDDKFKVENPPKRQNINSMLDEIITTSSHYRKSIEPSNTLEPNELHHQHQHPNEPFESYHASLANTSALEPDTDDIEQVDDEDLINIEEELDVLQNLMPRSKESKKLQDELSKAETEYYRSKTAYFTKLAENCKVKRTLMLLESRKLQLEIEKLTNES